MPSTTSIPTSTDTALQSTANSFSIYYDALQLGCCTFQTVVQGVFRVELCITAPPVCDLHAASKSGDLSKVKLVLQHGLAVINCQEWIGRTPVMWAAAGRHIKVVEFLVSKGANLTLVDRFGINILHSACLGGDVKVVKYVLSKNTLDINGRVRCGRTAVMLAADNGHRDVLELLVGRGANVALTDENGDNFLHCACREGHAEVVKYILLQDLVDINSLGHEKKSPVLIAGEQGHTEVVELLVKHGADLSLREKSGSNTLHRACYYGQFDVVKHILSLNRVDINCRGYMKRTPVMVAAEQGYKKIVELLVNHGADLSLREQSGSNILHNACYRGQFDVVKYILSLNRVRINSRGYMKRTPVMVAAEHGYKTVVELLVNHGADLSLREQSGSNILHSACYRGRFDVVKYVLSLNTVDINSRGWKKRTPVMVAAVQGYKEVVELLVEHGANLSLRDDDSKTIVDLVLQGGHSEGKRWLISSNKDTVNRRSSERPKTKSQTLVVDRI
ncbi:ankyrin repeat domain-containing protein 50-like [Haliotis asinina]|uniref:ankyrin repeat domain-containing protein 50-like n=1 Tax=Haliotis asinina TaxID=109174 RepID=UPI003532316C